MSVTDYIFSAVLIALIFRQVQGRRITVRGILIPVAIVVVVAVHYLHGFPTVGNDLFLIVACASAGLVLGVLSSLATTVYRGPDGSPIAKAGPVAVVLWVIGTGSRLAFGLYSTHGGAPAIARFSRAHHISGTAWVTALVLMALTEVVGRYGILALRALRPQGGSRPPVPKPGLRAFPGRSQTR